MSLYLTTPILLATILFFVWIWWSLPGYRVPKGATKRDLERLEAEDKVRQTLAQLFAGIALVATFALTIYQTFQSSRQWTSDYQFKQYTAALEALAKDNNQTAHVAAIYALHSLATDNVMRAEIIDTLVSHVRRLAMTEIIKQTAECGVPNATQQSRENADPEVQAAMNSLGAIPPPRSAGGAQGAFHLGLLRLDHLFPDDLDIGDSDVSNADMTQSHFRRVNFRNASLRSTNFGGADMTDYSIPGFPISDTADWLYREERTGGEPEWRRYRCWVTDFRAAHLEGAIFSDAGLTGADFRGATFDSKTDFRGANLSRANFKFAIGLTAAQLETGCADEPVLNDLGAKITACGR